MKNGQKLLSNLLKITILVLGVCVVSFQGRAEDGHDHAHQSHEDHEAHTHNSKAHQSTSHAGDEGHEEKLDAMAHIMDAHEWHFATLSDGTHWTLSLPVILWDSERGLVTFSSSEFHNGEHIQEHGHTYYVYDGYKMDSHAMTIEPLKEGVEIMDFSITKNVAAMFLSVLLMFFIFFRVKAGYKKNAGKAPKGIQSFFEPIIIYIRDEVAKVNIGHRYEKFMPYLLTIFFLIWFNNLMGLLPGAANLSGNIAFTAFWAVLTVIITMFSGKRTYWMHIFDPLGNSMPFFGKIPLYIVLIPIEVIGIFTKPFSLAVRLFANISAGHIIILSILGLTFTFHSLAVGIPAALFATVMNMLELFVAILQAYIFTMLSAMYFGQAVQEGHH